MSFKFREANGNVGRLAADDPMRRVRVSCPAGRTKQQFKDECDINNILRKFERSGLIDHVSRYNGQYADVTGEVDYQTALDVIFRAEEAFFSLPSKIRARFDNDPQAFLEFVDDPKNRDEMIDMGLARKPPPASPGTQPEGEPPAVPPAADGSPPVPEGRQSGG